MIRVVKENSKEYLLLLLGLLMQGFFGYRFVDGLIDTWKYSLSSLEIFIYTLGGVAMVGGYALIGYVGYLFLQGKSVAPMAKLLRYLGIYCLGELVLAVFWGGVWVFIPENIWVGLGMSFSHYLFRIMFLAYVFSEAYKTRIGRAKQTIVGLGLVGVLMSVLYNCFGELGGFYVFVESVCYYVFVVAFHTVCLGVGFTRE